MQTSVRPLCAQASFFQCKDSATSGTRSNVCSLYGRGEDGNTWAPVQDGSTIGSTVGSTDVSTSTSGEEGDFPIWANTDKEADVRALKTLAEKGQTHRLTIKMPKVDKETQQKCKLL